MSIVLAFITAVLWGFGNVFQKQGMTTSFPKISLKKVFGQVPTILRTLLTNWLWMLGTLMMGIGALLYVVALGLGGELTVVQPILCLTVVVSALVGVVWLKERVSTLEWVGIAAVFAGVVMVSIVKGDSGSQLPPALHSAVFYVVVGLLAAAAFLMGKIGISNEFSLALSAGLTFGLANVSVALLMLQLNSFDKAVPVFPDRVLGLLAGFPLYGVIIFNIVGSVFYQTAFANGRASIVASVCTIIGNTVPIVAAIAILGERVQTLHGIGILVVLMGAVVLAIGNRRSSAGMTEA